VVGERLALQIAWSLGTGKPDTSLGKGLEAVFVFGGISVLPGRRWLIKIKVAVAGCDQEGVVGVLAKHYVRTLLCDLRLDTAFSGPLCREGQYEFQFVGPGSIMLGGFGVGQGPLQGSGTL
jgi:hypothetical protein